MHCRDQKHAELCRGQRPCASHRRVQGRSQDTTLSAPDLYNAWANILNLFSNMECKMMKKIGKWDLNWSGHSMYKGQSQLVQCIRPSHSIRQQWRHSPIHPYAVTIVTQKTLLRVYVNGCIDSFRISSLKSMAVEIYKILNDMSPEYLSLFSKSSIPYSLRDNNKLIQQKMRTTTFGIKSFSYYGAHLWNSLPVDIKSAVTLGNFKTLVKNWQGPSCHCSVCQHIIWIRIFTLVVLISITVFMLFFSILSISRDYLTPKIRNTPTIHP